MISISCEQLRSQQKVKPNKGPSPTKDLLARQIEYIHVPEQEP